MPRPSNTDERRKQIVEGLMRVMAKRGYDGASIADVAKAAKLTPGLVHYHFQSKHQILLEALRSLASAHLGALEARLAQERDARAEVDAFIDFHLGVGATSNPEAVSVWILLSGEALRDKTVRAEFEDVLTMLVGRLTSIIERGVKARTLTCRAPEAAACALVATIQGYFVLAATARSVVPRGSAAGSARAMAAGLLGAAT